MNGRCEKDALDRAEDICELCGNQFCASCLLYPRGQKNPPTCKGCALANSGLRGTGSAGRPISRREYKKRKKDLLEHLEGAEDEEPALTYFDLNDPTEFDQSTELDRRVEAIEEPEAIDILAPEDVPPPVAPPPVAPPPPTGAADRAVPPPPPGPEAAEEKALNGLSPVDTSVNPLAVGAPSAPSPPPPPAPAPAPPAVEPVSEATASAAELLARLKADQPIQSQFTPPQRSVDTDPFATDPLSSPEPLSPAAPVEAATIDQAVAAAQPVGNPFAPPPSVDAAHKVPTSPPAAQPKPKIEPWTPPAPPPRGSNLDGMAAPEVPSPVADTVPEALLPPVPSEETPQADDQDERRKADTDDTGQWIPPSLRGMAPAEERAADPLPKRR